MLTPNLNELLKEEMINPKMINEIKKSIDAENPEYTPKQKAKKLAIIIYDILDHSLPNYSEETKRNVRHALLKQKLSLSNSLVINFNDIVESSIEIVPIEEIKAELPKWLYKKVDIEIEKIEEYMNTLIQIEEETEVAVTSSIELEGVDEHSVSQTTTDNLSNNIEETHNLRPIKGLYLTAAIVAFFIFMSIAQVIEKPPLELAEKEPVEVKSSNQETIRPNNSLPEYLQFESVNEKQLRAWLEGRDSMLADEPYFSTIISVADEYNLHPFLLFAITGQEQGFVPRSHQKASEIVNNPFNVFHSWEDFNTNILDSTQIAARTITNLSKGRPENVHPIKWINRKYAEDPNWWKGVSSIFEKLESDVHVQ